MADDGLSTTAIEWCIAGWDEQESGDGRAAKAREQLAALVEAAGRAAGARDETAALRELEAAVRCQVGHRDRNECGKVDSALAALDALRAGGTGDGERERKAAAWDRLVAMAHAGMTLEELGRLVLREAHG